MNGLSGPPCHRYDPAMAPLISLTSLVARLPGRAGPARVGHMARRWALAWWRIFYLGAGVGGGGGVGVVGVFLRGGGGAGAGAAAIELGPGPAPGAGAPVVSGHGTGAAGLYRAGGPDQPGAHAHRGGHGAQLWPVALCAGDADPRAGAGTDPADRRVVRGHALHHWPWRAVGAIAPVGPARRAGPAGAGPGAHRVAAPRHCRGVRLRDA